MSDLWTRKRYPRFSEGEVVALTKDAIRQNIKGHGSFYGIAWPSNLMIKSQFAARWLARIGSAQPLPSPSNVVRLVPRTPPIASRSSRQSHTGWHRLIGAIRAGGRGSHDPQGVTGNTGACFPDSPPDIYCGSLRSWVAAYGWFS
jgi:hypothetical protein